MASGNSPAEPAKRAPSRRGLYLPFILLGIGMLVWSGFWFYAANRAERIIEAGIAREAARGRDWRCPNRKIGGYPFRLEIACEKPQLLTTGFEGIRQEASLGAITLHAQVTSPGHFVAVMEPPFRLLRGEAGEVELGWQLARASVRAGLQGFSEASVELKAPVLGFGGGLQGLRASAKESALHLRRSPGEAPGSDLVLRIAGFVFAPLDRMTGNAEPLELEFQATAPGLVLVPNQRFDATLEAWRNGGGKARIVLAKASKGSAAIDLAGTLGLDSQRRLDGNLQGRARGLEGITANLQRGRGPDLSGLVGRLTGNQGIPVVLTFENGRLRYGPIPIAELRPLY